MYSYLTGLWSKTLFRQMAQTRVKTYIREIPLLTPICPSYDDISY